jgi:UDP-N-acetylmuramate--alanine ligase
VSLQVPGEHNVRNALAALSVAAWMGLPLQEAADALSEFTGTGRRFEVRGESKGVIVIDDYAHHPTEIRATLAAAKARYPDKKIWAVWQPHTYSRTQTLFFEFSRAFGDADHVLVTEVLSRSGQRHATSSGAIFGFTGGYNEVSARTPDLGRCVDRPVGRRCGPGQHRGLEEFIRRW